MTCIVGLVEEGNVYIGADSLASSAASKVLVRNAKIVNLKRPDTGYPSDLIIGYTSSWRMGQLLGKLKLPKYTKGDAFDWLSGPFVDAVRKQLKEGGWAKIENGHESGGEFLVAYDGRLFKVQSDFSVLETLQGFDACGSGEDWALGSLHASQSIRSLSSEKRVIMALTAAETFNPSVAAPFHVTSLNERSLRVVA